MRVQITEERCEISERTYEVDVPAHVFHESQGESVEDHREAWHHTSTKIVRVNAEVTSIVAVRPPMTDLQAETVSAIERSTLQITDTVQRADTALPHIVVVTDHGTLRVWPSGRFDTPASHTARVKHRDLNSDEQRADRAIRLAVEAAQGVTA